MSWHPGYAQETCEPTGIEFGFFNGVQTARDDAQEVIQTFLPFQYGHTTLDGEPIRYTLYYNDTEGFADFVETFEQRLQEYNGLLHGRFELFFSALTGGGDWWGALTDTVPALTGLLAGLVDSFQATLIRDLTADFGRPDTLVVAQRHREQIEHAVRMRRKLLLFAHSQGNLFVNQAYDHALTMTNRRSVRVVHVAPASLRSSGPHTLADLDLVINGLRLAGEVLPVTDWVNGSLRLFPGLNGEFDVLGHGLLEIYLNPAMPMAARIQGQVMAALNEMESPPPEPWDDYPDFVPVAWTGGEEPQPEYSKGPPSHSVERVVSSSNQPTVWRQVQWTNMYGGVERGWFQKYVQPPDEGWTRTTYSGRGVSGAWECTWGRAPFPGFSSLPWSECRYDRRPLQVNAGRLPDEVLNLGDVPAGTEVALYTQTYTYRPILYPRYVPPATVNDQASWRVDFVSGTRPRWLMELQLREAVQTVSEPYAFAQSTLQNQIAIEQWRSARKAYETGEVLRYEAYLHHRWLYEERRQRCETVMPDIPLPGPDGAMDSEGGEPMLCDLPDGAPCDT